MRKVIAFDEETYQALVQLGRDRMATFQELADEAWRAERPEGRAAPKCIGRKKERQSGAPDQTPIDASCQIAWPGLLASDYLASAADNAALQAGVRLALSFARHATMRPPPGVTLLQYFS